MTKTSTCLMALLTGLALTAPAFAQDAVDTPEALEADDSMTDDTAEDTSDGTDDSTDNGDGTGLPATAGGEGQAANDEGLDTDRASVFMTTTGMTYVELLSTLTTVKDTRMAMNALDDISSGAEIYIVRLKDLQGESGENASALMLMLTERQATMSDLHASVAANATVRTALRDANLLPGNVVAVHGIEDGRMIVVVDDSPI